jgi:hypothetical protein
MISDGLVTWAFLLSIYLSRQGYESEAAKEEGVAQGGLRCWAGDFIYPTL